MVKMTSLSLEDNTSIEDGFMCLTTLTSLTLNKYATDDYIRPLVHLTSLDVCYILNVTNEGIQNLTNLTRLNLGKSCVYGSNNVDDFGISKLTNLKELDLSNNCKLVTVAALKNLPYLTILDLSCHGAMA